MKNRVDIGQSALRSKANLRKFIIDAKVNKLESLLLLFGVATLPVYVFDSGVAQPAHYFFAAFSIFVIVKLGTPGRSWAVALLLLTIYSFLLESYYAIHGEDASYIKNSAFMLFNFIVVCAVYQYVLVRGLSVIVIGIVIATTIALASVIVSGVDFRQLDEGGRSTGTFNNPNQLGYFSVCVLSLGFLFYRTSYTNYLFTACVFGASLFISISSLSKAAIVANFAVILFALKPTSRKAYIVWSIGVAIGGIWLVRAFSGGVFDEFLFAKRILGVADESDSSLVSRGYFAILEGNELQLLLGLGARAVNKIVGHEVHSTFGSVLNNYGLLGFVLLLSAVYIWIREIWLVYGAIAVVCLVGPALLYGITHNGIRFTIFWLLFAATLSMSQREYRRSGKAATGS